MGYAQAIFISIIKYIHSEGKIHKLIQLVKIRFKIRVHN